MATYIGFDGPDVTGEVGVVSESVVISGTGPTPTLAEVLMTAGMEGWEFAKVHERFSLAEIALPSSAYWNLGLCLGLQCLKWEQSNLIVGNELSLLVRQWVQWQIRTQR